MEDEEYGEIKNGSEASAEQLRPTCDDDDSVVRDGNDRGDNEDHEVAEDPKAGAAPEDI